MTETLKKMAETTVNALGYTLRPHCTCMDEQGVAAQGYDVVAYYDEHAAMQGRESDTAEFNYALYWFKNGGNAIKFTASPGLYAPMVRATHRPSESIPTTSWVPRKTMHNEGKS